MLLVDTMKNAIKKMQANSLFRTLSSVKMAVPLLLVIATVVGIGTLYESRYNAEYARMMVYQSVWFEALLGLLGLNIFLATLSRLPWRKNHLGFLITHLGMITLLVGSWITKYHGLDGQLYVLEGQATREVALDGRVVEVSGNRTYKKVAIDRSRTGLSEGELKSISQKLAPFLEVVEYRPFVEIDPALFQDNGEGLSFKIKSQFFDQTVRLTANQPETRMGPATFRLVKGRVDAKPVVAQKPVVEESAPTDNPHIGFKKTGESKSSLLVVKDRQSSKVIREIAIEDLRRSGLQIGEVEIQLKKIFERAIVSNNTISDGGEKVNPAVEIEVTKNGKAYRDVLFARFPDFSMTETNPDIGVSFSYLASATDQSAAPQPAKAQGLPAGHPPIAAGASPAAPVAGNLMEFYVGEDDSVQLVLTKDGKRVLTQNIEANKVVKTPWMNMEVTLLSVGAPQEEFKEPAAVEVTPKADRLPPSAVKVKYKTVAGEKSFWLIEGQSRRVTEGEDETEFYYGREIIKLPFRLNLKDFHKKDYPGTETAMSFESNVTVDNETEVTNVSMNEPLKRDGYTLYQASYEMGEDGAPSTSVFSVNKDPGRAIKYLGSLITALGIIIFTVSRSRYGRRKASV